MSIFALTSDISPRPFNVAEVPVATSRAHSYWALRSFTALARTSSCATSQARARAMSCRLRTPTIRLSLLITGNLRTLSSSMCAAAC